MRTEKKVGMNDAGVRTHHNRKKAASATGEPKTTNESQIHKHTHVRAPTQIGPTQDSS